MISERELEEFEAGIVFYTKEELFKLGFIVTNSKIAPKMTILSIYYFLDSDLSLTMSDKFRLNVTGRNLLLISRESEMATLSSLLNSI